MFLYQKNLIKNQYIYNKVYQIILFLNIFLNFLKYLIQTINLLDIYYLSLN